MKLDTRRDVVAALNALDEAYLRIPVPEKYRLEDHRDHPEVSNYLSMLDSFLQGMLPWLPPEAPELSIFGHDIVIADARRLNEVWENMPTTAEEMVDLDVPDRLFPMIVLRWLLSVKRHILTVSCLAPMTPFTKRITPYLLQ